MHSVSKKCVDHKSFMMLAKACCTCSHISTCDMLGCCSCNFFSRTIIQMTSLMHHSSTPITGMRNPNQCSTLFLKWQFTPLCLLICMGCCNHIYMLGNNGHTRCASTPTWVKTFYSISVVTCMSVYCTDLHVCRCSKIFKAILIINISDNYGHVRMHVDFHLALNGIAQYNTGTGKGFWGVGKLYVD